MIWRLVGIAILIGLIQLGHAALAILPAPLAVLEALVSLIGAPEFWINLGVSLARVFFGLAAAAVFAFALSFLCFLSASLQRVTEGVLGLIRPIPPIAWIPLSVVIFGLSEASSVFVIFIGAFFPIFSSSIQALTFEGRTALNLARMIRGSSIWNFFDVVIPASLPTIFTGLSVAIGFAWMVVVVAEMIAVKSGLGYQIQIERQLLRLDFVVAYMAVIGVVGAALGGLATLLRDALMPHLRQAAARDARASAPGNVEATNAPTVDPGPKIAIRDVDLRYENGQVVLRDMNLDIPSGALMAIVGASGSGKTTLLRAIAGDLRPVKGAVEVTSSSGDSSIPGWVIQDTGVFDWMTVRQNVEFGIPRRPEKGAYPVDAWLALTNMRQLANRFPASLSGGQRQRVQIARALAARRGLVLLDEPFSALDAITREALVPAIRAIFKQAGRTCVLVTHDLRDAIKFADRVCVLDANTGRMAGIVKIQHPTATLDGAEPRMETGVLSGYFEAIWSMLELGGKHTHREKSE